MVKTGRIPMGGRIGLLLIAAVLPVAVLGGSYAWVAGETARAAEMQARYEMARVVAGTVERLVEGASRASDVILASDEVMIDPARCQVQVERLLRLVETLSDASIFGPGGRVCGLVRSGDGFASITAPAPVFSFKNDAEVAVAASNDPAIRIIRSLNGEISVLAHVGLAPLWGRLATSANDMGESTVFILTKAGGVIADPKGFVENAEILTIAAMPEMRGDTLPVPEVNSFEAEEVYVSVARVGSTDLRIAMASEIELLNQPLTLRLALVIGIPLMFLTAAVAIAWFGVDHLVNRWLRRLIRVTRRYGEGDLSVRVGKMEGAPDEFCSLAESFDRMASRIEGRSIELETALSEKDHFVRELHHRVKNNFQMIASLLTLQRREASGQTEAALREAHDRVQALASAYRASYADGEGGSVPVGALVLDLVERLRESAKLSSRAILVEVSPEPMSLELDRGIPFALLLTELIVPLMEHVKDDDIALRVTLSWDNPHHAAIRTTITKLDPAAEVERPLSDRLTRAYAAQLGATIHRSLHGIEITLPVTHK